MRPKLSHECPIALLEQSRKFNDYDYALVHLFEQYPEYYNFFSESLKMGREVILDNSIFELGTAFDRDKFAEQIKRLQPTIYVVPDVLENSRETIDSFERWLCTYGDLPGLTMGVVQGKTYEELANCYKFMVTFADIVGISFNYSYYEITSMGLNKNQKWAAGRPKFIRDLVMDGIYCPDKPIHLLGCALPNEFVSYQNSNINICSIDTSSPIIHGIHGIQYADYGLVDKKSTKMVDIIDKPIPTDHIPIINYNIAKFKELVYGKQA